MRKKVWLSLIAVLVLFGTWFYFTPHLTVHSIGLAVKAKDVEKLSTYVDFPAVRENLKASLKAQVSEKMARELQDNPFASLGVALASTLINPLVNGLLTPEGLAQLLQGQLPDNTTHSNTIEHYDATSDERQLDPATETSMSYESFDRFAVTITRAGSKPIGFVLHRDGLFSWKLAEIRLPL